MKKITKEQFLKDVGKEVRAIKKYATKEGIGNLDFSSLKPDDFNSCIYGQMTGFCRSPRAKELIAKCCLRMVVANNNTPRKYEDIKNNINGKPEDFGLDYFSLLEEYICFHNAKNKSVIDFIQNKTNKLSL